MSDNATGIRLAMEALEPNRRGRLERYRSIDAPIPKNSVELLQQLYKDPNEPLHTRIRAVQRSLHELDRLQCSDAADSEAISGVGDILGAIEAQNVGRE